MEGPDPSRLGTARHAKKSSARGSEQPTGVMVPASSPQRAGSRRRVVVLGSTGSIGTSCLDVIAHLSDRLEAWALCAHTRWETLLQQAERHRPRYVAVTDPEAARQLRRHTLPAGTELLEGADAVARMVTDPEVDVVLTAIVGAAGLEGTWHALE